MATKLEKALKRELDIGGEPYMLTIAPDGLKVVQKGRRKGLELAWKDLVSGDENTYSLVFPTEADFSQGRISVLAPIGMAILGYKPGDTIEWPVPSGMRKLKVEEILYQPESAGHYNL